MIIITKIVRVFCYFTSLANKHLSIAIIFFKKFGKMPTESQIQAALCAQETESQKKAQCLNKHEALFLLNKFFTQIAEQLGEGIKFCADPKSCAQVDNSLYLAMKKRLIWIL